MRRQATILSAIAVGLLVLAPALAEARAGGRGSAGSRGARTYQAPPPTNTAPGAAQRFDRTAAQPATTAAARPGGMAAGGAAAGQSRGFLGSFGGALLMGGLIGGLLGFGLFGGGAGIGAFLGMLLQVGLIVLAVMFVMRLIRGRRPAVAQGPQQGHAFQAPPQAPPQGGKPMGAIGAMGGGLKAAAPTGGAIEIGPSDYKAFERLLIEVNEAWSGRDLAGLRKLATPEMVSYFAQDLSDLEARNWRNEVRDLNFEQGDLAESWSEGEEEFATVAMKFSLLDATFDNATGAVVEGSTTERETATELWTFVRKAPAGRWMLSAIQQTA